MTNFAVNSVAGFINIQEISPFHTNNEEKTYSMLGHRRYDSVGYVG